MCQGLIYPFSTGDQISTSANLSDQKLNGYCEVPCLLAEKVNKNLCLTELFILKNAWEYEKAN